jgi:colicin import membrane protein
VLSPEEIDKRIQAKLEQMKTQVKNTDAQKSDALSPEEIDKRIQAKLEQMKTQVKERDRSGVRGNAPGSGPVTKGGTPGEGGGGIVRGLELIMYNDQIQRRVQTNWVVAEKKPGLVATVSFRIQPDGEMLDVELVKPSGDTAFDQSVVRAIKRTNPLPPPPQAYQQDFATQGVLMNFGGEGRIN